MKNETKPWSQYWAQGNKSSCVEHDDKGYRPEIKEYWGKVIKPLEAGDSVLDIGTGAGAIINIAYNINPRLVLLGIDSADIDYSAIQQEMQNQNDGASCDLLAKVDFLAHDFKGQQFDLITAQYAFEYLPFEPALYRIAELLKAGGQFHALMHTSKGESVVGAKAALSFIREISTKLGFFALLKQFIELLCDEREAQFGRFESSKKLQQLKNKVDKALKRISKGLEMPHSNALAQNIISLTMQLIQQQHMFTKEQMLNQITQLIEHVNMHKKRLELCSQAAIGERQIDEMAEILEKINGVSCSFSDLKSTDGKIIAKRCSLEKP